MKKIIILLLTGVLLFSCGTMKVTSRKYFSISNGEDINYYRLRLKARSWLGDAQFRSGWYPTESVDALFGNVSTDDESDYLKTKKEIEKEINKRVKEAYFSYLKEAVNKDAKEEDLENLLQARRRVLLSPTKYPSLDHSYVIEYDVSKGTAIAHTDEKMVFILSSNPDDVVGKIANFSESQETAKTIEKLSKTISYQQQANIEKEKFAVMKRDTLIKLQLNIVLDSINANQNQDTETRLAVLLNLLQE